MPFANSMYSTIISSVIRSIFKLVLIFLLICNLSAKEKDYYFYKPSIVYGSDTYFNPVNLVLNGSYDILRNGSLYNGTKDITRISYRKSFQNIMKNLQSPIKYINIYGSKKFIELEIFNLNFDPSKGHFLPNIANHVIGNGMLYVKLEEWYIYNNYPSPKLSAITTTMFYQILNEIVEHPASNKFYINIDSISDLLIFNPLGYLLFSFDSVKRLFSEKMPLYDWSSQPIINPKNNFLENAGQNYVLMLSSLRIGKVVPFIYWGIHGIVGFRYNMWNEYSYSFGIGRVVNRIKTTIKKNSNSDDWIIFSPDMDGTLSFFIDRKNSLLASILIEGPKFYNAQINIYPGIIKWRNLNTGMYIAFGEIDGLFIGITLDIFPFGLGINY